MCGILLAVFRPEEVAEEFETLWKQLEEVNCTRGPDARETIFLRLRSDDVKLDGRFFGSELRLRGDRAIVQPHRDFGSIFCWNGEVFEGLELDPPDNDGVRLFESIRHFHDPDRELVEILGSIEGPYAFCYFQEASKRIYFGRDPLGRRSLLIHRPTNQKPYLVIASVSAGFNPLCDFEEVSTKELFCVDLINWSSSVRQMDDVDRERILRVLPRGHSSRRFTTFSGPENVSKAITDAPPLISSLATIPRTLMDSVDGLLSQLSRSVKLMVQDIPRVHEKDKARVAILFSGGIDSTVLAYLADQHLPPEEPIDLLNVAFENPRKIRIRNESNRETNQRKRRASNKTMDSTNEERNDKFDSYLVPDRITGLEELVELRKACPHRRWNFVEVDVTFEEMTRRRQIVENIMHPCKTVMDLSLGLALYFASRGVGHVQENGLKVTYTSTARVLLNGLGSDELLGGYGRHRTVYSSGGWPAVINELQLEIDRLPTRNLGRDDRIISSHGKEARHPFLSLSVVNFIARLPVNHKMDPRLPLGLGDKMLLRLATQKVGLELASTRKKRAMQFGSHSARMEAGEAERRGDLLLS